MPMVWYIPPLSPVVDVIKDDGHDAEDAGNLFGAIDALRIPIGYLAELFTAGDPKPVRDVLARLAAMRAYMRDVNLGQPRRPELADAVGMSAADVEDMYRLLALAKYDERYVIPAAHGELHDQAGQLEELACSLDYDGGPGMGGSGPFGESSGGPQPIAVENFQALRQRQTSDEFVDPADTARRVNLLNWDGKGAASDLMPPRSMPQRRCRRSPTPTGASHERDGDRRPGSHPRAASRRVVSQLPRRRHARARRAARGRRRCAAADGWDTAGPLRRPSPHNRPRTAQA